jgi:putative transposase
MPGIGRLFVHGGLFHVMGRGLERRKLFNSDEDKADFLLRLDVGLKKSGHACYAWALIDNHYHLLLRQSERTLCSLMGPLLGGYALCFSRRHGRSGYLYQVRYRSGRFNSRL